jgi:hypothetical protein
VKQEMFIQMQKNFAVFSAICVQQKAMFVQAFAKSKNKATLLCCRDPSKN